MTHQLGSVRPDLHVFKMLPRLEGHVDPTVPGVQPTWFDQDPNSTRYPLDGNDDLSDCVAAWIAHQQESQARFSDPQAPQMVNNIAASDDVITWFWAECNRQWGTTPTTPPGPGLDPVQAALNWMSVGFPNAPGVNGVNKILGACTISLTNPQLLKWVGWAFRGFGLAVELPDDWPTTFEAEGLWQASGPPNPDNGHMTFVAGYNQTNDQLIWTWGTSKWATWDWVQKYGLFGIVTLPVNWQTIPGVNVTTLEQELQLLGGTPVQ